MIDHDPLFTIEYVDEPTAARGFLVVDTLINGVAGGGIRIEKGLSLNTVTSLAHKMTLKFTVTEPQIGGAKCGIDYDPTQPDKQEVLYRFIDYLKPFWHNILVSAADMNTRMETIQDCMQKLGIPSPQWALAKAFWDDETSRLRALERLNTGIGLEVDGIKMNDFITGYSVFKAIEETLDWQGKALEGQRVAIQGFGSVGGNSAHLLDKAGVKIVAISDSQGTIYHDDGLDISILRALRMPGGSINRKELPKTYQISNNTQTLLTSEVDVLVLAGPSNVIDNINVDSIQASIVVEGAIDPISQQAETLLHHKNVSVIPDFIASAGGASLYGILILGLAEPNVDSLLSAVGRQIQKAVRNCLDKSISGLISTRQAAEEIAYLKLRGKIDGRAESFQLGKSYVYV